MNGNQSIMNKLLLLVGFVFVSCMNISDRGLDFHKEIQADWLILYPQHILKNPVQGKIYGIAQDSIVNLLGLKLVSFSNNGEFIQTDSLFGKHGAWKIADTGRLEISKAGKGLENFRGTIVGLVNDTILIEEMVRINNESIKLIWHLKKISSASDGADLFKKQNNLWRQRPVKNETEKEIKERLVAMLKYYSLYFKVVAKESIYFSPVRVFLPFTYYQHGIGLTGYSDDFVKCFFDRADAEKGYHAIKEAFERTSNLDFPSGGNYVIEYSKYFQRLAGVIN